MTRRITKNDMLVYVPAVPATPFIPGYETVIKTWTLPLSDAESRDVHNTIRDWDDGAIRGRYNDAGTVIEAYTKVPAVAATPGVPAYTIDPGVAAWNAGGSTVSPLDGNGAFEFYIGNSPGGIVAGLSATDLSTLPSEPTHGFYIHGSVVQVIESGAIKHTFLAPVNATTRFVVRRTATTVYYEVDHTAGGVYASEYYTSDVPIAAGKIRLDAALYLSGDYVDAPSMIEGTSGMTVGAVFGTLRPVGGRIGDVLMVVYGELLPVSGLVYSSPLGAAGLFLGLSATTVKLLRYEGLAMLWVQPARAALLLAAIGWCLWLSWRVCAALSAPRRTALWLIMTLACSLIGYGWWLQFWGW